MMTGTKVVVVSGTYRGKRGVVLSSPRTHLGTTTVKVQLENIGFTLDLNIDDMIATW